MATACSSADELCTWATAEPTWLDIDRVMNQPIAATTSVPRRPPQMMIDVAKVALACA